MKKSNHRVSHEIKEQILKRIKEEGVPVTQAAEDHGVSTKTIYRWLTGGLSKQPTWTEHNQLKKKNKELMELIGELTVELSRAKKKN